MRLTKIAAILSMGTMLMLGAANVASADTWNQNHPGRTEVNHRLDRQQHRITDQRRDGDLTKGQAHTLRRDDHAIRHEERADASQNGGHLTTSEWKTINHQENQVSNNIPK